MAATAQPLDADHFLLLSQKRASGPAKLLHSIHPRSHAIAKKPAASPKLDPEWLDQMPPCTPARPATTIRVVHIFAPKVIKTDVANFRELVQRLTGHTPPGPSRSTTKSNSKRSSSGRSRSTIKKLKQEVSDMESEGSRGHLSLKAAAPEFPPQGTFKVCKEEMVTEEEETAHAQYPVPAQPLLRQGSSITDASTFNQASSDLTGTVGDSSCDVDSSPSPASYPLLPSEPHFPSFLPTHGASRAPAGEDSGITCQETGSGSGSGNGNAAATAAECLYSDQAYFQHQDSFSSTANSLSSPTGLFRSGYISGTGEMGYPVPVQGGLNYIRQAMESGSQAASLHSLLLGAEAALLHNWVSEAAINLHNLLADAVNIRNGGGNSGFETSWPSFSPLRPPAGELQSDMDMFCDVLVSSPASLPPAEFAMPCPSLAIAAPPAGGVPYDFAAMCREFNLPFPSDPC